MKNYRIKTPLMFEISAHTFNVKGNNMQTYNVVLELKAGGYQLLSHRNKTAWTKRTALKHAKDIKEKLADNMIYRRFCAVGVTTSDHHSPIEYI